MIIYRKRNRIGYLLLKLTFNKLRTMKPKEGEKTGLLSITQLELKQNIKGKAGAKLQ